MLFRKQRVKLDELQTVNCTFPGGTTDRLPDASAKNWYVPTGHSLDPDQHAISFGFIRLSQHAQPLRPSEPDGFEQSFWAAHPIRLAGIF
jgi:hypothetical protein